MNDIGSFCMQYTFKQECQTDTKYARQNADLQSCVTMKIIRLEEQIPLIQFLDKQHIRQV
jgi:hypothetical protein